MTTLILTCDSATAAVLTRLSSIADLLSVATDDKLAATYRKAAAQEARALVDTLGAAFTAAKAGEYAIEVRTEEAP
jgi:hypothetical protein